MRYNSLYFYKTPKDNLPKQVDNGSGYLKVSVNLKRSQYVHVLVCSNFIGVRPPKYDICHNDGDSKNNHISNLRYDTRKGNSSDKEIHGTSLKGEASPRAILTKKEVFKIREMMSSNHKQFIANKFNVSLSTIYDIDRRRSWNHI